MFEYQSQNTGLTLSEGLAQYFVEYDGQLTGRNVTPEAIEFFRCHDVVHVVFGCDIALGDELVVKLSSILGTTAGLSVLKGYRLAESKEIYAELSIADTLTTIIKATVLVPRTIWRCLQMKSKWHWEDFESHLEMPLGELRQKFGIRVAHSS